MDRLACVDVPALPLQLLLRRHPGWRAHPAAVVAEDKPNGAILWVNERARRQHILPGQRYAAGLSLDAQLRAGIVTPAEVAEGVQATVNALLRFSPHVEPSRDEPGVFWLDASGLGSLYPSLGKWARAVLLRLRERGLLAHAAVGFTRYGTYALARQSRGAVVLERPADEDRAARQVQLERLGVEPSLREVLARLGIVTLGDFLSLPAQGVLKRFGPKAMELHRLASGELRPPLTSCRPAEPASRRVELEFPETSAERLLFLARQALHPLLADLGARAMALAELHVRLVLQRDEPVVERIRPAVPTLDEAQVLDLVRLRLEPVALPSGVVELVLTAAEVPAAAEQLQCLLERPRRDAQAGQRALARLRAEFGDGAVVRARLKDGHLPEARFEWVPVDRLVPASPRAVLERPRVRRILATPAAVPGPPANGAPWMLLGPAAGKVVRMEGPYVVSGGWWARGVHREYHFALVERGDWLWLFYDAIRRRWALHGVVE